MPLQRKSGSFAMAPRAMVADHAVSDRAVRLYCVLTRYANTRDEAWPSQATLAKDLGCSKPTIERAVRELRETGWITVHRRAAGAGNLYRIHRIPELPEDEDPQDAFAPTPEPGPKQTSYMARDLVERTPPGIFSDGRVPSAVRSQLYRDPENEKETSPPRAAVRRRTQTDPDDMLDPARSLGLWDSPAPTAVSPAEANNMNLAREFRDAWRQVPGSLPMEANLKALAAHFKALRSDDVSVAEIRSMIHLFVTVPGLRNSDAPPWRDFLYRRRQLLQLVRRDESGRRMEADPGTYQTPAFDQAAEDAENAAYRNAFAAFQAA